jgi:hypothetical protein
MADVTEVSLQVVVNQFGPAVTEASLQVVMSEAEVGPPPPLAWYPPYVYLGELYGWRPLFPREIFDEHPPA